MSWMDHYLLEIPIRADYQNYFREHFLVLNFESLQTSMMFC
jgi:hypothetical protein